MRLSAIALLIFAALGALAEERCLPGDTPRQCVQRLITTRAYENAQAALAATNPGTSTIASPVRSAVKDFLSAASAQIEGSSVKDSGTALIIDYSFLKQVNLEAIFPDPAPSPAAATAPTEQLSRGDDVLVTLSYNLLTRKFGRNIDRSLFDSTLLGLISNTAPVTASVPASSYDTSFTQLFPDAAARLAAIAEYETATIAALPAAAKQVEDDFAQLANNQPQLFVSGLYHKRAAVVGPDERGFRVTWEIGTKNLNTFRDHEGRDCETRGDCLAAFTAFTARTAGEHRLGRLALAIQYGKTALNSVGTFNEVPTDGFTYMATYGQQMPSFTGQPARFDLSFTYDGTKKTRSFTTSPFPTPFLFVSSPVPEEPFTIPPSSIHDATAFTITQPVGGNVSVPISVVRLNHDDWLPSGDHTRRYKTEVRAAIRYQFPSPSHPPQNPSCCCK